jgi:hypothetical protein
MDRNQTIKTTESGDSKAVDRISTLVELVAQITKENRYSEISLGPELGKEVVEWDPYLSG